MTTAAVHMPDVAGKMPRQRAQDGEKQSGPQANQVDGEFHSTALSDDGWSKACGDRLGNQEMKPCATGRSVGSGVFINHPRLPARHAPTDG
jgi:hypothetical protein